MIKKISAIVLALVLCLSVVVIPTSALELADGMNVAFELKWDKEAYSAGETAYLSIYMKVSEDLEIGTGSLLIGLNSAVFNQTDNDADTVKANMIPSDLWTSFWKAPSNSAAWLASTITTRVQNANTDAENALYDHYFKITISRDTSGSGSHENSTTLKQGLPGADFNALADAGEPILTMGFIVASDVADGTAVSAGITSGSLSCSPAQTAFKYIKTPGSASTTANVAAATFDVTSAATSSTIGEAGKEYETSIVSYWKDQIKMENSEYTSFSIRHLAVISAADWEANFGTDEDASVEGTKNITDIGFILATGNGSFDKDAATDWLEAGATDSTFTKKSVSYVSTGMSGNEGNYVYSVVITGCTDKNASLSSLGYVVWEDAAGTTHYSYFEKVQTETFTELYDGYVAAH